MRLPGVLSLWVMLTETVIFSFNFSPSAVHSFFWFTLSTVLTAFPSSLPTDLIVVATLVLPLLFFCSISSLRAAL